MKKENNENREINHWKKSIMCNRILQILAFCIGFISGFSLGFSIFTDYTFGIFFYSLIFTSQVIVMVLSIRNIKRFRGYINELEENKR